MPLNSETIKKSLKNDIPVRTFAVIDSTNSEAKRRAGTDSGYVLYAADSQTSGRGRRGHSFYSPQGGLYMTLSLPLHGSPESVQRLTCASAVAVCEAINAQTGLSPAVKWVNDIYVSGRKVAGILAELVTDADNTPVSVIVGIGVNLTTADFPAEFAGRAGTIGDADPSLLCAAITDNLIERYESLSDNSFLEKYISLSLVIGERISYTDASGTHTAKAVTIAPDGSLVIEENGITKHLSSGEVSIIL